MSSPVWATQMYKAVLMARASGKGGIDGVTNKATFLVLKVFIAIKEFKSQ